MSIQGCEYAKQAFEKCLQLIEEMKERYQEQIIRYNDVCTDLQKIIDEIKKDINACEQGWY